MGAGRITWPTSHSFNEDTIMKQLSIHKVAFFLLALLPLTFWILVSCSSAQQQVELTDETADEWKATVDKTIPEPQRAAKLKELGLQLIDVSKSVSQDVEALSQKAMLLNENYGSTEEDFQKLVGEFVEKRNPKFARYRDIIFAMRSKVSAEEWKALMK